MQNGHVESFNSRLREECLNEHDFANLVEAQNEIRKWHRYYNYERPHSAIGWRTPIAFLHSNPDDQLSPDKSQ